MFQKFATGVSAATLSVSMASISAAPLSAELRPPCSAAMCAGMNTELVNSASQSAYGVL